MNRTVIIGALIVLLAAGGYYQFSYLPAQEQAQAEAAAKAAEEAAAAAAAEAEAAAAKAAEEAAAAAAKAAEDAAAAAAQAAADAAAATTEAATGAATATTEAATDAAAAEALDPANFDAARITALIDGSTLDDATKTTLKTAVTAAAANPALVADTVAQVRTALGL